MAENDNNKGPSLPAIILNRDQHGPFQAKLVEDQYGAHGIPYDFDSQYPNPPERQHPGREIDVESMIVSKYRAAIITKLLEEGKLEYDSLQKELEEGKVTVPFIPEAFRQAYQDVLDHVKGLEKLPKVKKEES